MRIAVIEHAESGDYAEYIYSTIEEKARQNNYQVKLWSNSVPSFQQQVSENAIIIISLESNSSFSLNWLYSVKIPSILKKTKAEIVVDLNGIASNKIKIPQIVAAGQSFFNDNRHLNGITKFSIKHLAQSLNMATNVLINSKEYIGKTSIISKEKMQFMPFTSPSAFRTYEWHEKIMVKAQQADNKEYFISVIEDDALNDFVMLLQAFSKFKKWQQSSMQLLVLPKYESLSEEIEEKYKTYKYREDVRLIEDIKENEIAAIIASAYAFIHIASNQPHLLLISIALKCSLPIISFADDSVKEYAGNAILFCAEKNVDALSNNLIQLYKDENLHQQLKVEAETHAKNLNREEYSDKLWQLLKTAAHS